MKRCEWSVNKKAPKPFANFGENIRAKEKGLYEKFYNIENATDSCFILLRINLNYLFIFSLTYLSLDS